VPPEFLVHLDKMVPLVPMEPRERRASQAAVVPRVLLVLVEHLALRVPPDQVVNKASLEVQDLPVIRVKSEPVVLPVELDHLD